MVRNAPKLIDYKSPRKGSMIVVVGKRGAIDAEYPYQTYAERQNIISKLKSPQNVPQIDVKPIIVPGPCAIIEMNSMMNPDFFMTNVFTHDSIFAEAAYLPQIDPLSFDTNFDVFNTFSL